jgi:hypothetical protein
MSAAHSVPRARLARRRLACEPLEARDVPSSVAGVVFEDLNQNGVQDPNENGLAGWTVFTDNDRNGALDAGAASAQTDATGAYLLDTTNVTPLSGSGGPYDVVALDLQTGTGGRWLNTTRTIGTAARSADPAPGPTFGAFFRSDVNAGFALTGSEQIVNQVTTGPQGTDGVHSVATDAAGDYVVAWRAPGANGVDTISARVFNADGTPRTGDLTVATAVSKTPDGYSWITAMPLVTMAANTGQFSVAWYGFSPATNYTTNTYVSTYTLDGVLRAGPTAVGASGTKVKNWAAGLAADAAGNFVVTYFQESLGGATGWGSPDLKAQRYTAAGAPTGGPISVASLRLSGGDSSVAMSNSGTFVVVYDDAPRNTPLSVYAQRYAANGKPVGSLVTVDAGYVEHSNVAMNAAGQYAISWWHYPEGTGLVRAFNPDGTPAGPIVQMPNRPDTQLALAIDAAGTTTVAWADAHGGDPYRGEGEVRAARLPAVATAMLPETLANQITQGSQAAIGLAPLSNGGFIAAFEGYGPGDDAGIFTQNFVPVSPLTAAAGPAAASTATPLTDTQLQPLVAEAIRRWERAGLTAGERARLHSAIVHVGDLDGATLGQTVGTTITIDRDAAGYEWFVDPTPRSDAEFHRPGDQGEQGRLDLLTAVEHELGHVLGRDHGAGVMSETLATGTRESIVPGVHVSPVLHPKSTCRPGWFLASGRR